MNPYSPLPRRRLNHARYDRYGNRWQQNLTQGNGPAPQYVFDNSTNRISGSGVTYDALGNVSNDGFHSYTYDAESRLIKADGGATATYTYDAEGRRIRNASSEFVYDLAGRAITLFGATNGIWNYGEIFAGGRHVATYSSSTTNFLHTDWLGTKRAMTNVSGTNSETCTGLPFGDGSSCTGTDWDFSHFTDDIHDGETNTEHTWFRQLSGTQGRWTSPDPYLGSIDISNPQSMNRYAYVVGDPVDFHDPFGLDHFVLIGNCVYQYTGTSTQDARGNIHFTTTLDTDPVFCGGGKGPVGSGPGDSGTSAECQHGLFMGLVLNATAATGLHDHLGAAVTATGTAGVFYNSANGASTGPIQDTFGAFTRDGNTIHGTPEQQDPTAFGVFGGTGVGFAFGNAGSQRQSNGLFKTIQADFALGLRGLSVSYAKDDSGTWQVTFIPFGGGAGFDITTMTTGTIPFTHDDQKREATCAD